MTAQLRDWHDFYILIGTASATLIGLLFVAASVGASYFNAEREVPLRAFLTPTVLHFSVILVSCLLSMAPSIGTVLGALLTFEGVVGIGYSCNVLSRMRRRGITRTIDLAERCCYIVIPFAAYLSLTATGLVVGNRPAIGLDMLGGVLGALLLLGIRNAWDMTLWIVLKSPSQ
jgi:hypothetical protein